MRIDIIHQRDPDCSCDIEVWVDGKRMTASVHEWSFDPGAGYEMDEFEETKRERVEAAPEFLKDRIAGIYDEMEPTYEKWSC